MAKEKTIHYLEYKWQDGRKFFVSPLHEGRSGGNAYGYSTGGNLCKRAFESAGWEFSYKAKVIFHYISPHFFEYIPGYINVMFTMWESEWLPDDLVEPFRQTDYIIVPSENTKVAIRNAKVDTPVFVCHHGVDTAFYSYKKRDPHPELIKCLWVGSPNLRKGYDLLTRAWFDLFHKSRDKVLLVMKSSRFRAKGELKEMPQYKAVLDTRNYTDEALRQLYWDCHVFLYPSRGEGAGLPPLEAMSTGLPVLAPAWSGMGDYMFNECSYPIPFHMTEVDYGRPVQMCEVHQDHFKACMIKVMSDLESAYEKGKKASVMVADYFSIRAMGERLTDIINEIMEDKNV